VTSVNLRGGEGVAVHFPGAHIHQHACPVDVRLAPSPSAGEKGLKGHGFAMQTNLGATGILILAALMSGCVAGSGDEGTGPGTQKPRDASGVFRAGSVVGLSYATATKSGVTDANGAFQYRTGEAVRFSVDGVELGSAPGAELVSPFTLMGVTPPASELELRAELDRATREATPFRRAINLQQLLVALDVDHDPTNGLDLRGRTLALAAGSVDFDLGVTEFGTRVQKLAPGLTRGIPASRSLALLYQSLGIRVPVHAVAFTMTSDDKTATATRTFKTYRADGSRATEGEDQDNDGDPESLRSWTYNSQGRLASEDVRSGQGSQKQRYRVEYEYNAQGTVTGGRERVDSDGDGNFDSVSRRTAVVDDYGMRKSLLVERDQGADGTVDSRDAIRDEYDARRNRVLSVTETESAGSIGTKAVNTQALGYDTSDRKVSDDIAADENGDGIADNRVRESVEYAQGSQPGRRVSEQDRDGDGVIDLRYVSTSGFDAAGNEVTRTQEIDDGADGVIDRVQFAQFGYDSERRLITQKFRDDLGADGVIDATSHVDSEYDAAGHLLSQSSEFDFDNDGVIDSRATTVASAADGAQALYQNSSYGDGTELLSRTDTLVSSQVYEDGVLLLAQQYFGH
jgi:hypothetical protein